MPSSKYQKPLSHKEHTFNSQELTSIYKKNSILQVGSTVGESASKVAEHDHGAQAKELVDTTRQTGANVGAVGVDLYVGSSLAWHGGTAALGATKAAEAEEEAEEETNKEEMTDSEKKIENKKIKLVDNTVGDGDDGKKEKSGEEKMQVADTKDKKDEKYENKE